MNNTTSFTDRQEEEFEESKIRAEDLEKQFNDKAKEGFKNSYAPLPLQRESGIAKPYPFDALGSIAGAVAKRIHEVVQAPDATCGQSILAALSLACQGFIDVQIDGRTYPSSLFMLTISESGERKSAADKIALRPINDWQRLLVTEHKKQLVEYKNKIDVWKLKRGAAIKAASESKGDKSLTSLELEPQQPCEGLIICEEPTLEGLEQLLERGQPSAGVFSDEGGRLVGGHAMNSENALKTACGFSNLWDGKPLTRVRKSEGSKIYYGRRLAVHLMIQPVVLMQLLSNEMLMGQGLLARCLFSAPAPIAGYRKYNETDLSKDADVLAYYNLMSKILDRPYSKKDSEFNDNVFRPGDSLEPIIVPLQDNAKVRWREFHDNTDIKMRQDGEFYSIKSFASKAAEHVLRIAAILAYVDSFIENDTSNVSVSLNHLNRAVVLVEYYLGEALRIMGKSDGDPNISLATLTLEWIKRNRSNETIPIADIYQRGPSQIRNAKVAKRIMKILEEHGHVVEIINAEIKGNKVRSAWRLKHD